MVDAKDEFVYKIYTVDIKGRKVLMCKSDNPSAAQDTMQALCNYYKKWSFELYTNGKLRASRNQGDDK